MRIMPYRTGENVIDGAVVTFVDVNETKKAEVRARETRLFFENVFEALREPALVLDEDLRVVKANRAFYRRFSTSAKRTEGEEIFELGQGEWDVAPLRELLEKIIPEKKAFDDLKVEVECPNAGRRTFLLNARRLETETGAPAMILLAMEDATEKE